jgi:phosphoenolpyruvate carboxykinase (GTP)
VLKWVVERIEGRATATETPIGHVPTLESLDTDGLDMTEEQIKAALHVSTQEWAAEIPQIQEWFDKFGDTLPPTLLTELAGLKNRLGLQQVPARSAT